MGGKSKSSSSSTNNQRQVTTTADGNAGVLLSGGGDTQANVNILDGGAIEQAFSFASDTMDDAFGFGGDAFGFGGDAFDFGESALDEVADFGEVALDEVSEFSQAALDEVADFGEVALDGVMDFGMYAIDELSGDNKEFYNTQTQALERIGQASRSETAQQLSQFSKYFFGAMALMIVVGGVVSLKKRS